MSDEASVAAAVELAAKPLGGLHIAVANAGTGTAGSVLTMAVEQWRYVLDVNLTGTFLIVKHAGWAIARSSGGSIVVISLIAGPLSHRFM